MRTAITLILLSLLVLTGCKNINDLDAVIVLSNDKSGGEKSAKHTPPPHAPAHGQRAKHGPPPHAPAHGYRHELENGIELVFDSGLSVYVVINHPDVYFHNELYLRFFNDNWIAAVRFDGPWDTAQESQIPRKLKKTKGHKNKGKGKGRGND